MDFSSLYWQVASLFYFGSTITQKKTLMEWLQLSARAHALYAEIAGHFQVKFFQVPGIRKGIFLLETLKKSCQLE